MAGVGGIADWFARRDVYGPEDNRPWLERRFPQTYDAAREAYKPYASTVDPIIDPVLNFPNAVASDPRVAGMAALLTNKPQLLGGIGSGAAMGVRRQPPNDWFQNLPGVRPSPRENSPLTQQIRGEAAAFKQRSTPAPKSTGAIKGALDTGIPQQLGYTAAGVGADLAWRKYRGE